MEIHKKINISEVAPLNNEPLANIYLNMANNTKTNSNAAVIHLKADKSASQDMGVHINTTMSISSSKKIKLLFILNFVLCIICMMISCTVAVTYWREILSLRYQVENMKEQLTRNIKADNNLVTSTLPSKPKSEALPIVLDEEITIQNKINSQAEQPSLVKDLFIAHFVGAEPDAVYLGREFIIGPWFLDENVSSGNTSEKLELYNDSKYVKVKEGGIYLIYSQIVYNGQTANCYYIFARTGTQKPRFLTMCGSGEDTTKRPITKSQMSCYTQTITRLFPGEIIKISQREQNMTVYLKPGYSHIGFIKIGA